MSGSMLDISNSILFLYPLDTPITIKDIDIANIKENKDKKIDILVYENRFLLRSSLREIEFIFMNF